MGSALIGLICFMVVDFIKNAFFFVIDFILITEAMLPTDVLYGLLDVDGEIFSAWLPYINWFIPLDYAVLLFGTFIDLYGTFIVYKYFKKIISSIFSGGGIAKILAAFLK